MFSYDMMYFPIGNIEVYKSAGFGSSYGIKTGLTSNRAYLCKGHIKKVTLFELVFDKLISSTSYTHDFV